MPSELRTGDIAAGFRITSLIGQGAVGSVYLAEDVRNGNRVALKLLGDELAQDERFRQRFLRESELAASLDHPHVVPTLAAGEAEDGRLYLAMEYVDGSDLRDMLRREGTLEPTRAIDLVGQVGEALDAAHEAGLVHRDVKPGNVLVTERADGEHAYVCDFGLGEIDRRADVYSLGCVLFECLAGSRPFERDSELSVVFAHLNEPPPRLSDHRPELPQAFDDVVATALAKSPDERYATCGELVAAARAALRGETYERRARPRRWRYVLAGAALLVVGAAAIGARLATRDDGLPRVSISQTSIAGGTLGQTEESYKQLYGAGWRSDLVTEPNFPALIFVHRRQSIYFDPETRRSIIVTTWNPDHRTAAGVGPCSSLEELESAYGSALKPSRWNTQEGKVYAYTVGENLLFAFNGRPPNPSKRVTAVALYDGDGPSNDGRGVDVKSGTLPFAGYIALNESVCS